MFQFGYILHDRNMNQAFGQCSQDVRTGPSRTVYFFFYQLCDNGCFGLFFTTKIHQIFKDGSNGVVHFQVTDNDAALSAPDVLSIYEAVGYEDLKAMLCLEVRGIQTTNAGFGD